MTTALRGQVYSVDLGGDKGRHYYVVVSNNVRNRNLRTVLAVMVTSSDKSGITSAVQLSPPSDPVYGWLVADNIEELWDDELTRPVGVISPNTMSALNAALKVAFALT